MEGLGVAASVIAVVQLSAKVGSLCTEYFKAAKNARSDIKRLQRGLGTLNVVLRAAEGLVKGSDGNKLHTTGQLKPALDEAKSQLDQLIDDLRDKPKARKGTHRNFGALKWPFKRTEVDTIIQNLERHRDNISMALDIDNTAIHIETCSTVQEIRSNVQHISRTLDMSKIPVAKGAAFDSYVNEHDPRCLPNTRVQLLDTIAKWAGDPDSDTIFWLNGMAGTGKSTISRTIAHSFAQQRTLGASFFFKRGERDRGNASRLFSTIAAQLIVRLPEIGPLAIKAIEDEPDLPNKFIQEQFEKLILDPLQELDKNISGSRALVLIIDALDECDRDADVRLIINILTRLKPLTVIKVKAFVTSRPELPIRLGFNHIKGKYRDLILHEIPKPIIEHDISEFLHHQLEKARLEHNCQSDPNDQLDPGWPGTQATNILIEMAIPLFIFAATMCRFIQDPLYDPASQLEKVLSYKSSAQDSEMKKLDTTYRPTLDQLLVGRTGRAKEKLLKNFRDVVGVIVLLEEPLSISTLSCFVDIPECVSGILRPLHSVLSIPTSPHEPVRMLHLSFHDFLVDKDMQETNPFWVNEQETHNILATRCLDLLGSGKHLKQDICDLGWPGARRGEIKQENLGLKLPDQVRYACLYWTHHLNRSGLRITDSHPAFSFLKDYFLFWLEALAILGEAHNCSSMINALQSIVDPKHGARLLAFLRDATRFVARVDSIINEHPLQIYTSGLVFAPKESIVRAAFRNCVPEWITQFPQVPQNWNTNLRVIETPLGVADSPISFLPDSRSLQVVSRSGVVQVWDSTTGKQLDSIDPDGEYGIIFSSDGGCSLSTNRDGTILFWGSLRGSVQHQFEEPIVCLSLSGDGKLAACALQDGAVFVLDYLGSSMRRRFYGEKRKPGSIALSPDGELLAITQSSRLQLWDVNTGRKTKEISDLPRGMPHFSPNSRLILLLRHDAVGVYDIGTDRKVQGFGSHTNFFSAIAFSPDSQHVASASQDGTASLWHLATGEEVHRFQHDCNMITHLVFSPDGCLLAASSPDDSTILLWDPNSTVKNVEIDSKGPVQSLALSRDGKRVASAFRDRSIGIWDLDTAYQVDMIDNDIPVEELHLLSFSQAHEGLIWSVSFDGIIQCYDTLTGGTEVLEIDSDDRDRGSRIDTTPAALSPDGNTIALAFSQSVQIWNLVAREMQHTLNVRTGDSGCIGFSSDSKKLALSAEDYDVTIWDLASARVQQTLSIGHHYQDSDGVTGLSLHDSKLAISSDSGRLAFWDIKTGAHLGSVQADGCFGYLQFAADGSRLVTERGDIRTPPLHCNGFDDPRDLHDLEGYGLTEGHAWISWKSRPFMWLPRSHRPSKSWSEPGSSLTAGSTVILGSRSGLVSILKFAETPPWASKAMMMTW
ncbi:hypothetical protein CDV31_002673 [Fusarium ambrosium]|uniref:NACHT domain-containing protein n=1 Tax=Fusarium ambrosium TaxID=131363 RepID=A0A428UWB1_9HYPO|nr:hypothetical protein CDV31_002673 [Fusarium ambrosium]